MKAPFVSSSSLCFPLKMLDYTKRVEYLRIHALYSLMLLLLLMNDVNAHSQVSL